MPNVALHFLLAAKVIEGWRRAPQQAPFPLDDDAAQNAFHHGAVGPDMGFFPGGERRLSELSHTDRSGDLARALVRGARTVTERAYAWGWVTHLLGDVAIHPLVGLASGELVLGDGRRSLVYDDEPGAHVAIELGLDVAYFARPDAPAGIRLRPLFDAWSARFVCWAYRTTYGEQVAPGVVLACQRNLMRLTHAALFWNRWLARDRRRPPLLRSTAAFSAIVGLPARLASRRAGITTATHGFLNPVRPSSWLRREVDRVVDTFYERFAPHYATRLASLANHDLETGAVQWWSGSRGGGERRPRVAATGAPGVPAAAAAHLSA